MNKAKLAFLSTLALFSTAQADPGNLLSLKGKEPFVPGEVLVRFKDGTSQEARAKSMALVGASQALHHPTLIKVKLKPGMDVPAAVAQLQKDPSVQYAQPNYRYYALCGPPLDMYYATPVPNQGGTLVMANWPFTKIQAPQAWNQMAPSVCGANGPGSSGVTVAVLDTGVSRNNPDLRNVPLIGYNAIAASGFWDSSCNGLYSTSVTVDGAVTASTDDFGHGTYTAGIIGAAWDGTTLVTGQNPSCPDSTTGMAGLAPGCILMAIKVLDCTGGGSTESIVLGTEYAISHGARVLNFSLGSPGSDGLDPAEKEALDQALAANCVIVASSGNESDNPGFRAPVDFPAAYPPVISVGATDQNDQLAFYSNGGANLKLVAPGGAAAAALGSGFQPSQDVMSGFLCPLSTAAVTEGGFATASDSNFGTAAGTSASAPFVSGAAALILSAYPNLTNAQVSDAIVNNTDSLNNNQGWNPQTGYGRLNVYQALLNAGSSYPSAAQVPVFVKTFNSPNPFYTGTNGSTNITLAINQPVPVELTIYDASGEEVFHKNFDASQLNENPANPQFRSFYVPWDGRNGAGQLAATGIYFYTVKVNGQVGKNKIALIQGSK